MGRRPKAVALLSGGLDSTLAVLVLLREGIDVTAVTFLTHFGCDITDSSSCSRDPLPSARRFGFEVRLCHLADKFIEIVKNPKYGHGKNMNPCIDCRILMLREAKVLMDIMGADFLVTGEVLGQRPMSQRRACFPMIDREAGVEGLVLRPLSARLMPPTLLERRGLIRRERLYSLNGRTRKPQMALAEEFGLDDYPAPAGGCLLTEPVYSCRLRDLLRYNPDPELRDIHLLRVGRHFRSSDRCKIVVGRNELDNERILSLLSPSDTVLNVEGVGSPVTIVAGAPSADDLLVAASITARYSDAKRAEVVDVRVSEGALEPYSLSVSPAADALLERYRIAEATGSKKCKMKAAPQAV